MSNYQSELAELFEDGEDVILYESLGDALEKMDFYLKRDDLREKIAVNGYLIVKEYFSYEKQLGKLLTVK